MSKLFATTIILRVIDNITTYFFIKGDYSLEANPVVQYIMESVGWAGFIAWQLILLGYLLLIIDRIKYGKLILITFNVMQVSVILWNLFFLLW